MSYYSKKLANPLSVLDDEKLKLCNFGMFSAELDGVEEIKKKIDLNCVNSLYGNVVGVPNWELFSKIVADANVKGKQEEFENKFMELVVKDKSIKRLSKDLLI